MLAEAGYRAVALDMRGYGRSSRPLASADYAFDKTSADVLAIMDHFSEDRAVIFGHDFGANLAWHMGIHCADRVRAIAPLSVPYDMELAGGCDVLPSKLFAQVAEQHFFHMHYFQEKGVAEDHFRGNERDFLMRLLWALSGKGKLLDWSNFPAEGTRYLDVLAPPPSDPPWSWLSAEDFEYYLQEYLSAGPELAFIGGLNSYRAMDHNWRLFRDSAHAEVPVPVCFVAGAADPVITLAGDSPLTRMREKVPDLRGLEMVAGAGHFIQQEAPEVLNRCLLEFLESL